MRGLHPQVAPADVADQRGPAGHGAGALEIAGAGHHAPERQRGQRVDRAAAEVAEPDDEYGRISQRARHGGSMPLAHPSRPIEPDAAPADDLVMKPLRPDLDASVLREGGETAWLRILNAIEEYVYTGEFLPDGAYRVVFAGPCRERFLGLSPAEGRTAIWADYVHPEDMASFETAHDNAWRPAGSTPSTGSSAPTGSCAGSVTAGASARGRTALARRLDPRRLGRP